MALILTITNRPFTDTNQETSYRCDNNGTIGRSASCDWVLHDPSRYISGKHATISQRDGKFYVMDTSTNGLFINNSALGKGNSKQLNDGDKLRLGQFEISAVIEGQQAGNKKPELMLEPKQPASSSAGNLGLMDILEQKVDSGAGAKRESPQVRIPEEESGLIPKTPSYNSPPKVNTTSDSSRVLEQHFAPPPIIPDDWDFLTNDQADKPSNQSQPTGKGTFAQQNIIPDTGLFAPTSNAASLQPKGSDKPINQSRDIPVAARTSQDQQATSMSDKALLQSLLSGMGIQAQELTSAESKDFANTIGQAIRATVEGMVTILRARTAFKSEFRMEMTTIKSQQNNPLKFSVGTDEVLKHMFFSHAKSYLPPLQSLEEGFQDIQAHQMAMMAGMQAALQDVLKQFDPVSLEQMFDKQDGHKKLLPGSKKSRYWDAYTDHYNKLLQHIQDDFHAHFGKKFTAIYEEQVAKLKSAGKPSF